MRPEEMSLDNLSSIVLPFGKHKGEQLDAVPRDYLGWLILQDWLKQPLKGEIAAYLKHPTIAAELQKRTGT